MSYKINQKIIESHDLFKRRIQTMKKSGTDATPVTPPTAEPNAFLGQLFAANVAWSQERKHHAEPLPVKATRGINSGDDLIEVEPSLVPGRSEGGPNP